MGSKLSAVDRDRAHRKATGHNHIAHTKMRGEQEPLTVAQNTIDKKENTVTNVPATVEYSETVDANLQLFSMADFALVRLLEELIPEHPLLKEIFATALRTTNTLKAPRPWEAVSRKEAMDRLQVFFYNVSAKKSLDTKTLRKLAHEQFKTAEAGGDHKSSNLEETPAITDLATAARGRPKCEICWEHFPNENRESTLVTACLECWADTCLSCLKKMFRTALKDPSSFPAKCCTFLPLHFTDQLEPEEADRYRAKFEEWLTVKRSYCPVPTCSTFLPNRLFEDPALQQRSNSMVGSVKDTRADTPIERQVAKISCPTCAIDVCVSCKQIGHEGPCKSRGDNELDDLIKQWGYKRCPKCGHGVRRMFGCSHMQCLCGASFCWKCVKPYNACECYNEDDDDLEYDEEDEEHEVCMERRRIRNQQVPQDETLETSVSLRDGALELEEDLHTPPISHSLESTPESANTLDPEGRIAWEPTLEAQETRADINSLIRLRQTPWGEMRIIPLPSIDQTLNPEGLERSPSTHPILESQRLGLQPLVLPVGMQNSQVAAPSDPNPRNPTPQVPNLDARGESFWANSSLDFGEEPAEENQDTSWFCQHRWPKLLMPIPPGRPSAGKEQCLKCWKMLFPGDQGLKTTMRIVERRNAPLETAIKKQKARKLDLEKAHGLKERGDEMEDVGEEGSGDEHEREPPEKKKKGSKEWMPCACTGCGMILCANCAEEANLSEAT